MLQPNTKKKKFQTPDKKNTKKEGSNFSKSERKSLVTRIANTTVSGTVGSMWTHTHQTTLDAVVFRIVF